MRYRLPLAVLLVALICLSVLWLSASLSPVATAQTAQPTAAPTPTPTRTPGELIGFEIIDRVSEAWARYSWGAIPLAVLVVLLYVLFQGAIEAFIEHAKETIKLWISAPRFRRQAPDIHRYLEWLRREHGWLPQIGVATEQVKLDVESVYIPLNTVERGQIEAHHRRMRGEDDADEASQFYRRGRRNANRGEENSPVLTLLSDKAAIAGYWQAEQRRARFAAPFDAILARLKPDREQRKSPVRLKIWRAMVWEWCASVYQPYPLSDNLTP